MVRKVMPMVEVQTAPPPDHGLRNAAIVAGAVGVTGGAIALGQLRVLKNQKAILQRAAKRARADAYKEGIKAAKTVSTPVKTPVDPHLSQLKARLHQNRFMIDFPRPGKPDYDKRVTAIMQHVHSEIPEAETILKTHMPKEAAEKINAIKTARISNKIGELKTARQDRLDEGSAWERFHATKVAPYFKGQGIPNNANSEHPYKHWVYSKPHKAVIDPNEPPELPTRKKRSLERLIKLIELDVNLKESRGSDGKFSSGGAPPFDPAAMQYAYHMPMVNPNGTNGGSAPRGRGRPPGSLNVRTVQSRQVEADAIAQQPEAQGHPLLKAGLVGAGALAVGGLVAGPKIAKVIQGSARDSAAVNRILPKIESGKYLSFADRAFKKGQGIEEAIKERAGNIRGYREARQVNAAKWSKSHPGREADNPYTNPPYAPASKQTKAERASAGAVAAAQADLRTEKSKNLLSTEQLAHTHTKETLASLQKEHKATVERLGETSQKAQDLKKQVDEVQKTLDNAVIAPSSQERVKAALATLKQRNGETLTEQESTALRKHYGLRTAGVGEKGNVKLTVDQPVRSNATQGDLLDVVNTATPGRIGQSPVPYETMAKHVEFLKQRNLASRGDEIAEIAKEHGHSTEDIAHAMALRQAAGGTAHIVPHAPEPAPGGRDYSSRISEREKLVAARDKELLNPDVVTKSTGDAYIRGEGNRARESYAEEMRRQGRKPDQKERERLVAAAESRAAEAYARQAVSEKRVKGQFLRGMPVVGKRHVTARELAFSRRLRKRIELTRQHASLVEFSSFVRDIPIKHLPANVQSEIGRFVKTKPGMMVSHYSMVADELVGKCDPHNLATAKLNVEKRMSQKAAREEVHGRREKKPVLIMNDRVVDGHHFIGKAMHGKVSSSLHVIDLTPSRFQMEAMQPGMIELASPLPSTQKAIAKFNSPFLRKVKIPSVGASVTDAREEYKSWQKGKVPKKVADLLRLTSQKGA